LSQSETDALQKRAFSMNQFRKRARLHAAANESRCHARILVNAGYGYRAVKKAADPREKLRLSDEFAGRGNRRVAPRLDAEATAFKTP
jgi:hypothetical protein